MKPRSRIRHKGRKISGTFTALPHVVQDSENWRRCSSTAIKLLLDIARLYRSNNNGDLAPATLKSKPASEARTNALRELCHYGLLRLTRQGGLGFPSLYALTWHPIDFCGGKLDCDATTVAPGDWAELKPPYQRRKKPRASSKIEAIRFENRTFRHH